MILWAGNMCYADYNISPDRDRYVVIDKCHMIQKEQAFKLSTKAVAFQCLYGPQDGTLRAAPYWLKMADLVNHTPSYTPFLDVCFGSSLYSITCFNPAPHSFLCLHFTWIYTSPLTMHLASHPIPT